jgi:hypothetical protein
MKMKTTQRSSQALISLLPALFPALLALNAFIPEAHALDQIIRPYWSARSAGMGGVRMTTGMYEENFFNNPARVTANPKFRLTLFDVGLEGNSNLPNTISNLTSSGDLLTKIGSTAGDNNHIRLQTTFPSIFFPTGEDGKWAFAFGLTTSTQADVGIRQSFQLSPQAVSDIGATFTVGRKLLADNSLSVGMNSHFMYRLASDQSYTFVDLIKGRSLSPLQTGGQGAGVDFDLGSTYELPIGQGSPFRYSVGASLNNVLGGRFSNINLRPVSSIVLLPIEQPRTLGFGFSARRESWWKLTNTTFALEFTDLGNNANGSLFRTIHLGGETHWSVLAFRAGLNQGYWALGLGVDFRYVTLDLATYGEEMSLNTGGSEDRRYALRLAFQI